jgi:hypothetical protein
MHIKQRKDREKNKSRVKEKGEPKEAQHTPRNEEDEVEELRPPLDHDIRLSEMQPEEKGERSRWKEGQGTRADFRR